MSGRRQKARKHWSVRRRRGQDMGVDDCAALGAHLGRKVLGAYLGRKAVFNAEYRLKTAKFCANDERLGIDGARYDLRLTGVRRPCR